MRITFVLPFAGMSGGVRVVGIYAKWLKEKGHQVCVVSVPRKKVGIAGKVRSLLRGDGWVRENEGSHLNGIGVEHRVLEKRREVRAEDVPDGDMVVATWWETAEWVWKLPRSKGAKAYLVQHYEIWGGDEERVKATYRLPMGKIVVAEWLKRLMEDEFGQNRVWVVMNGVDRKRFYREGSTCDFRFAICDSATDRKKTVGMMYSAAKFKGSQTSLQAWEMAREQMPGLKLLMFGQDMPERKWLERKDVEFEHRPTQERIREIYSMCDVWLFGSQCEGFGLPVLEAMACGTPVIGTRAGAAPELLTEGGGLLVDNAEQMAAGIVKVCQMNKEEWRRMSEAAEATAKRHTWEEAGRKFEAVLEEICEKTRMTKPEVRKRVIGH